MLDLDVVGDDFGRRSRHGEDLTVPVVDARAQCGGRQIHADLGDRERGVVRVIDDLDEEESHTERDEG